MSTTNTPGPWYIGLNPGPFIYGPQGEQVADMRDTMLVCSEHAANAALIAAAPTMFEFIESVAMGNTEIKALENAALDLIEKITGARP